MRVVDAAGEPVAACVELIDGEPEAIVVCDDDEDDGDDRPGQVRIEQVPAGPYSVALYRAAGRTPGPRHAEDRRRSGRNGTVDFTVASGPGTLVIFVEDEDGERIGGACFTLEGETEAETLTDICDQGDDGRLNFPDLPSGDYTIVQTRAGENRQLAPEQSVTVEPGQTVEITRAQPARPEAGDADARNRKRRRRPNRKRQRRRNRLPRASGHRRAAGRNRRCSRSSTCGPDGSPLGDGCFVLTDAANEPVAERCDNDASDFDNTPGVVAFGGIPAGQYTLTQTAAAEGFSPAAPVAVEHGVDDTVVEMVSEPAAEETGVVELATFDDAGNPVATSATPSPERREPSVPSATTAKATPPPIPGCSWSRDSPPARTKPCWRRPSKTPDVEQAQQARPRRSVSVRRGDRPTRAEFSVRAQQNQRGDRC